MIGPLLPVLPVVATTSDAGSRQVDVCKSLSARPGLGRGRFDWKSERAQNMWQRRALCG